MNGFTITLAMQDCTTNVLTGFIPLLACVMRLPWKATNLHEIVHDQCGLTLGNRNRVVIEFIFGNNMITFGIQ